MIKMDKVLKNATIIYNDGSKENYEAISITLNGVYTGKIESNYKENNEVKIFDHRFIPFENIERIIYLNKSGKEKKYYCKDFREEKEK